MSSKTVFKPPTPSFAASGDYSKLLEGVSELLESARRASTRAVNAFMTATYWELGRRIVEFEQCGEKRAGYGEEVMVRLAGDLAARFGRGFSRPNLQRFRQFYLFQSAEAIRSTLSSQSEAPPAKSPPFALQMHVYLNYAREHWMHPGENPPAGVILCSGKGQALVRYATDSLPNKLLVREYLTALPDEKTLPAELEKTRKALEARK